MAPSSCGLAGSVTLAAAGEFHCGECPIADEDAVRIFIARRFTSKRLTGFKRPAGSIRLECLELFVLFEAGIVIFPPGPGWASSSRESNSSELLTWITFLALLKSLMFSPVVTAEDGRGGVLIA
jgi:hypothetical protein